MNQNCFRFLACSLIAAIAAVAFVACHVPSGSGEPSPSTTTYTVTYNGNGNTAGVAPVDPLGYAQGSTVMVSSTLPGFAKVVSGITYTFIGWNTKANGSGTPYVAGQTFKMGNADVILYADWTTLPTNVLTFDSQGGTAVLPQNVVSGSLATEPTAPVKSGSGLVGWFRDSACTTQWNFATDALTQNTTLYAEWCTATNGLAYTLIDSGTHYSVAAGSGGSGAVVIPAYWAARPVTAIADNGFKSSSGVTSLTIPARSCYDAPCSSRKALMIKWLVAVY